MRKTDKDGKVTVTCEICVALRKNGEIPVGQPVYTVATVGEPEGAEDLCASCFLDVARKLVAKADWRREKAEGLRKERSR